MTARGGRLLPPPLEPPPLPLPPEGLPEPRLGLPPGLLPPPLRKSTLSITLLEGLPEGVTLLEGVLELLRRLEPPPELIGGVTLLGGVLGWLLLGTSLLEMSTGLMGLLPELAPELLSGKPAPLSKPDSDRTGGL